MLKNKLKIFFSRLLNFLSPHRLIAIFSNAVTSLKNHINTWPRLGLSLLGLIVFLYYPLGAMLTHSIDTNTAFELPTAEHQSATVSAAAGLIKREINNKIWTPNLPFFFPSSVLDNMPAFQTGLISGIAKVITPMSKKIPIEQDSTLVIAAKLLNYPPNIWIFSPQNKLLPAPSSNSQYRRARKHLMKYNEALASGETVFLRRPQDLSYILNKIRLNLQKSTAQIEHQIRENSTSLYDLHADEVFYRQQGLLYAYYIMLNALAIDYKDIVVAQNIYERWTILLKVLEYASKLNPLIVRNGQLDSLTAPNHLAVLGYYTNRAVWELNSLIQGLNKKLNKDKQ